MPAKVQVNLIVPTGRIVRTLRRYNAYQGPAIPQDRCPLMDGLYSYHNGETPLDVVDAELAKSQGNDVPGLEPSQYPKTCLCGYEFKDGDERQVFHDHEYRDQESGECFSLRVAPPGSAYWADWLAGHPSASKFHQARGNTPHLMVKLPGGYTWDVDQKSTNGEGWERTGDPAEGTISATPSIRAGGYHGYLTNRELLPCPDSEH